MTTFKFLRHSFTEWQMCVVSKKTMRPKPKNGAAGNDARFFKWSHIIGKCFGGEIPDRQEALKIRENAG